MSFEASYLEDDDDTGGTLSWWIENVLRDIRHGLRDRNGRRHPFPTNP